jgi:ankyrin repeat protein
MVFLLIIIAAILLLIIVLPLLGLQYLITWVSDHFFLMRRAIHSRDSALVRKALANGEDPNQQYLSKHTLGLRITPLMHAATVGDPEIIRILVQHGANLHDTVRGQTALNYAVESGNTAAIQELIAQGMHHGGTEGPIEQAIRESHIEVIKTFLDAGVSINEPNDAGRTLLFLAVHHSSPETVALLLERGANPTVVDNEGNSPLLYAILACDSEKVALLLQHGAQVSLIELSDESINNCLAALDASQCSSEEKQKIKDMIKKYRL